MDILALVAIGAVTGVTTVMFGFGGGFVTVPVVVWADADLGSQATLVAVATSALVMVVNAVVATLATPRRTLRELAGARALLALLSVGGLVGAVLALWVDPRFTQWAFVAYLVVTIVDTLARPGFLRPKRTLADESPARDRGFAIPDALGIPVGGLAAFLGVGGSVMTVPLLRRAGYPMKIATALANPLTLTIAVPAMLVFLVTTPSAVTGGDATLVGSVDVVAAAALLVGALPVVVTLRRRPPRVPDHLYAWSYVVLLVIVLAAMVAAAVTR